MRKETKQLIFALILVFLLIIGIIAFLHFDELMQISYKNIIKSLLGLLNIVLTGTSLSLLWGFFRIKRLNYALSSEMGFIARAVFYVLSEEKIKAAELKETFTVTNAVIHSVGADIALLDKRTSQNILEFHSLMKVVINTLETSEENMNEKLNHLFFRLTETVYRNPIAKNIVETSRHARMGLLKAEQKKVDLV